MGNFHVSSKPSLNLKEAMAVVVCGPSGVGKTTFVNKLISEYPDCVARSVSHTTREKRPGEVHGVDYFFIERREMQRKIQLGEFIEHNEFAGNLYGTSIKNLEETIKSGKVCILTIDITGLENLKEKNVPMKSVFIMPPSVEVLKQRMAKRNANRDPKEAEKRLEIAQKEMFFAKTFKFDAVIVNDEFSTSYAEFRNLFQPFCNNHQRKNP